MINNVIKIALTLILISLVSGEETGIKLLIKDNLIKELEDKYLPTLMEKLKNTTIPDISLGLDIKIGTVYITMSKIKILLNNVISENLVVTFSDPNKINLSLKNINGTIDSTITSQFLKVVGETDILSLTINQLDLDAEVSLSTEESIIDKGKLLPSGGITNINLSIDFDYNLQGGFIAKILNLAKGIVKPLIQNYIKNNLLKTVQDSTKNLIKNLISNQTVYYTITENGLALDYSLVSTPKIENKILVLNAQGAIIDLKNKADSGPYKLDDIMETISSQKNIELILTNYTINTALYTLYNSGHLEFTISTDDLPKNLGVQLNTTTLQVFINNMTSQYGIDKKIKNVCSIKQLPFLTIIKDKISGSINTECALFVENEEETWEEAIKYSAEIELGVDFELKPNGILTAKIYSLLISNSQLIESKVPGADIEYVEQLIDFATSVAVPVLNNKYLKEVQIPLPKIEGISIEDSTATVEESFISIGVSPVIPQKLFYFIKNLIEVTYKNPQKNLRRN